MVIESVASIPIKEALQELVDLIKEYCGGEINIYYLDKDLREIEIK